MIFAIDTPTRFDDPNTVVRQNYDSATKQMLIDYMESVEPNSAGGYVEDIFTGNITSTPDVGYEDDKYSWSTQDIYYLKNYDIAVESNFIDHVKSKKLKAS